MRYFTGMFLIALMLIVSTATHAQSIYLPLIRTEGVNTASDVSKPITSTEGLSEETPVALVDSLPPLPKEGTIIAVTGPSTKGSVIDVNGKAIKLPETVYVSAYIVGATCVIGARCMNTPAFVLSDDALWMRVEADGQAYTHEELDKTAQTFAEVLTQLEVELKPLEVK